MGQKNEKPKRSNPVTTQNATIATIGKLKKTQTSLSKREEHLESQINMCVKTAKEKMKGRRKDKRGAMFQLKRKKMLEKRMGEIQNFKLNLEQQIFALEGANTNQQMVGAISSARDQMVNIQKTTDIDQIDTLREDMDDINSKQEEITSILAEPMGTEMDEDELDAEFADLEAEMAEDDAITNITALPAQPTTEPSVPVALPRVPATDPQVSLPPAVPTSEDAELAELEALMA